MWNVLLQVLDDGRLTDGQGRTVDFKNTVIILTSNVGSMHIMSTDDPERRRELVMADLRASFRPEFLNRLDETVIFHRLEREDVRRIVDVQLLRFGKRLMAKGMALEVSDDAKDYLANVGYDPAYGARPLKRSIQRHLENPLAQELLSGRYAPGDTVVVDMAAGDIAFGKKGGVAVSEPPPSAVVDA